MNEKSIENLLAEISKKQSATNDRIIELHDTLVDILGELTRMAHAGQHLELRKYIEFPDWYNMPISVFWSKHHKTQKWYGIFDLLGVDTMGGVMCHTQSEIVATAKKAGYSGVTISRFLRVCWEHTHCEFGVTDEKFAKYAEQWVNDDNVRTNV